MELRFAIFRVLVIMPVPNVPLKDIFKLRFFPQPGLVPTKYRLLLIQLENFFAGLLWDG